MRYVMAINISGSADGRDWPRTGEDVPDWLDAAALRHMVEQGQVKPVVPPVVEPDGPVELAQAPAPETRVRRRPPREVT
jgi:hypothetical protein